MINNSALYDAILNIADNDLGPLFELTVDETKIYLVDSELDGLVKIDELKKYLTKLIDSCGGIDIDILNYFELPASNSTIIVHACIKSKAKRYTDNSIECLLIFSFLHEKISSVFNLKLRKINGSKEEQKKSVNMQNLMEIQFGLTKREGEVAQLLYTGLSPAQVANKFTRSQSTVKTQIKSIYKKMGVGSRQELVKRCFSFTE